jgi:hypothetical protein
MVAALIGMLLERFIARLEPLWVLLDALSVGCMQLSG